MSTPMPERGPTTPYQVVWANGHTEVVNAHQVSWPGGLASFLAGEKTRPRVQFHAEVDGRWQLVLDAVQDDVQSIRNLAVEVIP